MSARIGRIVAWVLAAAGFLRLAVYALDWIGRAFDLSELREMVGRLPAPLALPYELFLLVLGPIGAAYLIWDFLGRPLVLPARTGPWTGETSYWSICQVVTWLAYGKAMKTTAYSLDGIDILEPEELPAVRLAEQNLLTALQDSHRIVAYGRRDGRGEHAEVPFTYFLSTGVSTNIFNDSFGLGQDSSIEDIQNRSSFPSGRK